MIVDKQLNYGRHQIARFLREAAPFENVVDLGAGAGADLALARQVCPAAELFAIEAYPSNVQKLREHYKVFSLDLERDPLPFADESIDVMIANQVLEHVKEIFWIFHQASRVLRVGGRLIIGVPNLASYHNRLLLLLGKQPTVIQNHSAHVRGFSKHDLLRFLDLVVPGGFALRGFGGSNFYPLPPLLARPMARLLPSGAWGIFFLLEKRSRYAGEFLEFPLKQQLETNFYVGEAQTRQRGSECANYSPMSSFQMSGWALM
jgi:SAM-dependent methyltransferase